MTCYGFIRAISAYFVVLGLPEYSSDLIPLFIATLESTLMFLFRNKSYSFNVRSLLFFHYAVFKSTVFLCIPQIENIIISKIES